MARMAGPTPWRMPKPGAREARFEPMTSARLDAVLAVEQGVYGHPWSRRNFSDSLEADFQMQCLVAAAADDDDDDDDEECLIGYFVAMLGYREVHLLNITVAPGFQGQGWGGLILDALALWARGQQAEWLWLEVRAGNTRAQQLYRRRGFAEVGTRKSYYPLSHGRREDAVVLKLRLLESGHD